MKKFIIPCLALLCSLTCGTGGESGRNTALAPHANDLVALSGDHLAPFDAGEFLRARYIVLYFGAGWCPDCRRFSPALVRAYDAQPAGRKSFEVLLVSHDKSADGMLRFMNTEKMRWPALLYEKVADDKDIARFYSGHGIPCLTVIDAQGRVILQSKNDQDATEILDQLRTLVATPAQDKTSSTR